MVKTTKTLILSPVGQIIDLNEKTLKFEINFTVNSLNKVPFFAAVITQKDLDEETEIKYQEISEPSFSKAGKIVNDTDNYNNFLLILKAEKACECQVIIDKKVLEEMTVPYLSTVNNPDTTSENNFYYWIKIGSGIILVAAIIYFGYKYRKEIMDRVFPQQPKLANIDTSI